MKKLRYSLLVLCFFYTDFSYAELSGRQIFQEVDQRDQGWQSSIRKMRMLLINKKGKTSERKLVVKNFDGVTEMDRSLIVFESPKTIQGTTLLTHSHYPKADDQWLYIPSIKRVKRISASNKSSAFMGSELAYEDFSALNIDKYTYSLVGEGKVEEKPCYRVEAVKKDGDTGYSKLVNWVDKSKFIIRRTEFFDKRGAPLKVIDFKSFKKYEDRWWRADELMVTNLQNGNKTSVEWSQTVLKAGIDKQEFAVASIKNSRF